jgi:type I restriction-modification system DNA methylase subunit
MYEYFLNSAIKNDQGQYFTPREIVDAITQLQQYKVGERICDPFAGTGGFLRYGHEDLKSKINITDTEELRKLNQTTFYGQEAEADTAALARMNMFMLGAFGENIVVGNSLETHTDVLKNQMYNKITTNIPFVGDPSRNEARSADLSTEQTKHYPFPTNVVEILAILKVYLLLKDNGQAAAIVPASMLSRKSQEYVELRKFLFRNTEILLIAELPQYTFTHTPAASAIVVFRRKKVETQRILFTRLQYLGYSLDKEQRKIEANDLPKLVEAYNQFSKNKSGIFGEVRLLTEKDLDIDCRIDMASTTKHDATGCVTLASLEEDETIVINPNSGEYIVSTATSPIKEVKVRHLSWTRQSRGRDLCVLDIEEQTNKVKPDKTFLRIKEDKLIRKNDVLFVSSGQGSMGKTALVTRNPSLPRIPQNSFITNVRILDRTKIDPIYLYWVLGIHFKTFEQDSKQMKTARVTERWDMEVFKNVPFKLPTLVEQKKHVEKLAKALELEEQAHAWFEDAVK